MIVLMAGNLFAQDSLQVQSKKQNRYQKQMKSGVQMMEQKGAGFVDADGDGVNDNALDADGDGIPNGQDPDYVKPQDGSGAKKGSRAGNASGTGTGDCDGSGSKGSGKK